MLVIKRIIRPFTLGYMLLITFISSITKSNNLMQTAAMNLSFGIAMLFSFSQLLAMRFGTK